MPRWKFTLRLGVMHVDGADYVFNTASGELDELLFGAQLPPLPDAPGATGSGAGAGSGTGNASGGAEQSAADSVAAAAAAAVASSLAAAAAAAGI